MNERHLTHDELKKMVIQRFLIVIVILAAMFFLPAWTFAYWEAWLYMAILIIPMFFVGSYLLKNDPDLLERRMRMREKRAEQKLIIQLSYPLFLLAYLLPGFDHRLGWSNVPPAVVIIADSLVFLGYGLVFLVFRENRYASRIVEVDQEQEVISSGPYAIVRHPMYVGTLLMYCLSPLALGSYWAVIPAVLIIPFIIARILTEEATLAKELKGYPEYMQKVKYRLIPGIW